MLRFAVLNGLRPEIANFVTQKQPTDLENLLETARLGEMCAANQPNTDTVVTKQLTQMQDQLRQLSMKFDTPTAAPISDVTRGRMSPRRVQFDDENDKRSRSYDRRPNYDNRRSFDRSNSPVTRQRGFGRGTSSSYRWSRGDYPSKPHRGNVPTFTTYRGRDRPFGREQRGSEWSENCDRCGLRKHNHFNECPAINQNCRGCGAKGHFLRRCRQVRRAQNNWD